MCLWVAPVLTCPLNLRDTCTLGAVMPFAPHSQGSSRDLAPDARESCGGCGSRVAARLATGALYKDTPPGIALEKGNVWAMRFRHL